MDLEISPDNKYVAAYTNNSQTILLNTLVSEFIIIDSPLENNETVQGICMLDTNLVIYGQSTWVFLEMSGKQKEKGKISRKDMILKIVMKSKKDFSVIHWSGDMEDPTMAVETYKVLRTTLNLIYIHLLKIELSSELPLRNEIRVFFQTESKISKFKCW